MPLVKCSTAGCVRTISYTCDKATVIMGMQNLDEKTKEQKPESEKKIKRTLTLECFDGHRSNYSEICEG